LYRAKALTLYPRAKSPPCSKKWLHDREPYRWVEAIANRREYIEGQLAPGSPIAALGYREGILFITLGQTRQKLFEIYDRIAMGGIGHPAIERVEAAIDCQHRGFEPARLGMANPSHCDPVVDFEKFLARLTKRDKQNAFAVTSAAMGLPGASCPSMYSRRLAMASTQRYGSRSCNHFFEHGGDFALG